MNQFTPQVSEQDVERVLRRDVPVERQQELREMIQDIQVIEKHRVILACMKHAGAEYPFYTKKMFRIDKLTEQGKADIIEKDKTQYLNWFNRGKAS